MELPAHIIMHRDRVLDELEDAQELFKRIGDTEAGNIIVDAWSKLAAITPIDEDAPQRAWDAL